jgi:hypothetical protein
VCSLVWFRRDLERPAALGLIGAAIALTGGAFHQARQNALKHFREVEAHSAPEAKVEQEQESAKGETHVEQ